MAKNPVVLTADQEDAILKRKVWNSGHKLWKLKSSQPHLFLNARQIKEGTPGASSNRSSPVGIPGFEQVRSGWLFHSERQLYLEESTQKILWHDTNAGVYSEYNFGEDLSAELVFSGVATTSSASRATGSKPPSGAGAAATTGSARQQSARHLVIMDLHKAADMFKLDLNHMDKPAAMIAVYKHSEGAVAPEMAAKGLHEKILRRVSSNRSSWSNEDLQTALSECMATVAAEQKAPTGIAGVVTLIFGPRLVVAASHGSACAIADALPGDMKDIRIAASSGSPGDAPVTTACITLCSQSASCVLLHTEAIDEQAARAAAGHAERSHPRAGAVALLQGLNQSSQGSRAAACVHLAWISEETEEQKAKRAKVEKDKIKENKVRCRQVLLKYEGCKKAIDPVRKKTVSRSLAEAEAAMLGALQALEEARVRGGAPAAEEAFTKQCRAMSECTSSLKGGDLAGDIGWLKLPEVKLGEKVSKEIAQKIQIINKALSLSVGEVSEIGRAHV